MAEREQPYEQLLLVSAEVDRQLEDLSLRQANALTRASIVLAASAVSAFTFGGASLGWSSVTTLFSLLSAFLCVRAIGYWKSKAVEIGRNHRDERLAAAPYSVLDRQVDDKFEELEASRADLKKKTNYLSGAIGMLGIAWLSAVAIKFVVEPLLNLSHY